MNKPDVSSIPSYIWLMCSALGIMFLFVVLNEDNSQLIRFGACIELFHYTEMHTDELIECLDIDFEKNKRNFLIGMIFLWISNFVAFFVKFKKR